MKRHRQGIALVYAAIAMTVMIAVCVIAVEVGRMHLVKTELQRTADAAARAGASRIRTSYQLAYARAKQVIESNVCHDGVAAAMSQQQVTPVLWNTQTKDYDTLPISEAHLANAVLVTATRSAEQGNAVPMIWGSFFQLAPADVSASAVAMVDGGDIEIDVHGTTNPYTSGMPSDTTSVVPDGETVDTMDNTKRAQVNGLTVIPGKSIQFSATGGVTNDLNYKTLQPPDGEVDADRMFTKWQNQAEHGMSTITAPPNCLIGVFLSDEQPDKTPAPKVDKNKCPSDFSSDKSRNWGPDKPYQPALKQIFYIGDGKTDKNKVQNWLVPDGATRLFLGTMDEWEWNNNKGSFQTRITGIAKITTVQ